MKNSAIEWCEHTFNPWLGCSKVSAGCDHCYAERQMDTRMSRVKWGVGGTRVRTSAQYWKGPEAWNRTVMISWPKCGHAFSQAISEAEAMVCDGVFRGTCCMCGDESPSFQLRRPRVFCASLADVFEPDPGARWGLDAWRAELFDLIRRTPNLDWLLLTKRPAKWAHCVGTVLEDGLANCETTEWLMEWYEDNEVAPNNVWIGATVENQEMADSRIPDLLKIPARVRFLSCEPLLSELDVRAALALYEREGRRVDWLICGGESGPKARPMHPDWARSLRDQCRAAGVPFLFKQWGEWGRDLGASTADDIRNAPRHCFPGGFNMFRIGKRAAGRTLDGLVWNEFPEL